jgi:hypothetical protein
MYSRPGVRDAGYGRLGRWAQRLIRPTLLWTLELTQKWDAGPGRLGRRSWASGTPVLGVLPTS